MFACSCGPISQSALTWHHFWTSEWLVTWHLRLNAFVFVPWLGFQFYFQSKKQYFVSIFCTLWFVTHNKILRRAERSVDISTSLQTDIWNLYSRRPVLQPGFPLSSVRKVMLCVSKPPTNWHWHWAEMIHGRKSEEWSFSSEKSLFHGGNYSTTASTSCSPCPVHFTVLLRYIPSQIDSVSRDKQLIFLLCLSMTSYDFYKYSTEFHRSYLMHFKEMYRCMLG